MTHRAAGGGACWCHGSLGYAQWMPPKTPNFTPLEWRQLAHACQTVAEKSRARATELAGDSAAHGFVLSAELFERLAARCVEMTRPAD